MSRTPEPRGTGPFRRLFGRFRARRAGEALYAQAMRRAREPSFYRDGGVPDSFDGRFDMVALHVFLLLRRLREQPPPAAAVAQALISVMMNDMNQALREAGVGDYSVGKRLKHVVRAFYGRAVAYDEALAAGDGALEAALRRNLYRNAAPAPEQVAAVADYVRRELARLDATPLDGLLQGEGGFGPVPEDLQWR